MLELLRAELKRTWTLYWRYPMDYVSGLFIMLVTFYALVMGARYIAGPASVFGDRLDSIILGYWLWNMAVFSFSYTATAVNIESMGGTLEQIFLSPFGPVRVFIARSVASLGLNLATSTVLLGVLLLLSGRRLSFPPLIVVPLVTLLLTTYGIGFLVSGLTLLAKRTSQLLTILQFLLLPLVLLPIEAWGAYGAGAYLLPIVPSAAVLRGLMARQEIPPAWSFAVAALSGILYFAGGVILFRVADRQARLRGLLGQH
jgi:ABC-2 type transport system permease protein